MNKIIITIILALILGACGGFRTKEVPVVIFQTVLPDLPPIDKPAYVEFDAPEWDYPRLIKDGLKVKNTTACKKVEEANHNDRFWRRCGEFPRDQDSNIYMGFTRDNYNLMIFNWAKLKTQLQSYSRTIDRVNEQREKWILKNETEALKAKEQKETVEKK